MFDTNFDEASKKLSEPLPSYSELSATLSLVSPSALDICAHCTLLHVAAKYDTLYSRNAMWTKRLVEDYNFDPNVQSSEGSLPVMWAISAYVHSDSTDLSAINYLLSVPKFDQSTPLLLRSSLMSYVKQHYAWCPKGKTVLKLLQAQREKRLCPLLLARFKCRSYMLE